MAQQPQGMNTFIRHPIFISQTHASPDPPIETYDIFSGYEREDRNHGVPKTQTLANGLTSTTRISNISPRSASSHPTPSPRPATTTRRTRTPTTTPPATASLTSCPASPTSYSRTAMAAASGSRDSSISAAAWRGSLRCWRLGRIGRVRRRIVWRIARRRLIIFIMMRTRLLMRWARGV